MKYISFFLFFLFVVDGIYAQHLGHSTQKQKQKSSQAQPVYTCPMHPEVRSSSAGRCPKCGMTLVKKAGSDSQPKMNKRPKGKPATHKESPVLHQHKDTTRVAASDTTSHHTQDNLPLVADPVVRSTKVNMQPGKTVRYDLYITDTMVNYTGKHKHAYAINGTIPGPDLVFTEGDTAEIYLHNHLRKEKTSLHWHGVILPNRFDGVPYLTTAPVDPGRVHLYKFAVVQNGTYWYHSHSGLQEQAGIYGALIFRKRKEQEESMVGAQADSLQISQSLQAKRPTESQHTMHGNGDHANHRQISSAPAGSYDLEKTVVLSEWTDEHPHQVLRRLRNANDWYAIRKGSTQSYSEAIKEGYLATKLLNEWKRMNAMDVSDVFYDRFLLNGLPETSDQHVKKGDRVRLRIVNAGASSYFWVQFAGGKMTVIANDGNDVVPVDVDRLIVGVSETYDVVVSLPGDGSYEFRATAEDRTGAASLWLGTGTKMQAPKLPALQYFEGMKMMNDMMKMNGDLKAGMNMSLQQMDMNAVMYRELAGQPGTDHSAHQMNHSGHDGKSTGAEKNIITLNYGMLRSTHSTRLPVAPTTELLFTLTGNMNRYVWSINEKIVREWDKIRIEKGHNLRIILFNNSMMRHPMHLHGHDFRVLNRHGDYAPLKNVLDIMPMERDTIEFAANKDGDWFFHCHILYHMMTGMGNVFSYNNSFPNPDLPDTIAAYNRFLRDQQMFLPQLELGLESNGSDGSFVIPGERFEFRTEWRFGIKPEYGNEVETYFGRYFGKMQWFFPFIGFDYHKNSRENELTKNSFGQLSNQSNRQAFFAGFEYVLPMLLRAQARMDTKGKLRFQIAREDIPLTPRLRLNIMGNTDKEYMAGFRYVVKKWFALSTHYDSDMGFGAGVTLIY